jgi:hypothetical protein
MRSVFHLEILLRTKSLHGTGQGKMETCPTFWRNPTLSVNGISSLEDGIRLTKGVADRPSAICSWKIKLIRHRTAPIRTTFKRSQPIAHTQNTSDVSGVAVRVPATGVDDGLGALKVALTIEQTEDDQAVIGNDVAVSAIFVVAVLLGQFCARRVPIPALPGMPISNIGNQAVDDRASRNKSDC